MISFKNLLTLFLIFQCLHLIGIEDIVAWCVGIGFNDLAFFLQQRLFLVLNWKLPAQHLLTFILLSWWILILFILLLLFPKGLHSVSFNYKIVLNLYFYWKLTIFAFRSQAGYWRRGDKHSSFVSVVSVVIVFDNWLVGTLIIDAWHPPVIGRGTCTIYFKVGVSLVHCKLLDQGNSVLLLIIDFVFITFIPLGLLHSLQWIFICSNSISHSSLWTAYWNTLFSHIPVFLLAQSKWFQFYSDWTGKAPQAWSAAVLGHLLDFLLRTVTKVAIFLINLRVTRLIIINFIVHLAPRSLMTCNGSPFLTQPIHNILLQFHPVLHLTILTDSYHVVLEFWYSSIVFQYSWSLITAYIASPIL